MTDLPRPVRIASTKYDGSIHYEFEAELLSYEGAMLTLRVARGTVLKGYRGDVDVETAFTALFWTDRHYNIYHNVSPAGRRGIMSYANIATPARLDGDVLRWIDLDLDVFTSEDGTVTLDDVDEFEEHRARFAYPDELVAEVFAARDELLELAKTGGFPFDREAHLST
jgi:protein associated with RNAse G/E